MKLLSKANIYYLAITLFIFFIAGIAVYYSLKSLIYEEVDELLKEQKYAFIEELKSVGGYDLFSLPGDSTIVIGPRITADQKIESEYNDIILFSELEEEFVPYRQLAFTITYNEEMRLIQIRRSLFESEDLFETILFSLSVIFVMAVFIFTTVNYFGLRHLWNPFYQILENIKTFDLRYSTTPKSVRTNISEFQQMESILNEMTSKLRKDYMSLKEFSENASHEMQTPLAIIRTKLDMLLQKIKNEEEINTLDEIYTATNRLARLHKSLNLLTRLGNKEFREQKSLYLKMFLEDQIEKYRDIISFKKISLSVTFNDDPFLNINEYLFEILISNLIGNAINHNVEGGRINIVVNGGSFEISNDGVQPEDDPEVYFERFKKGQTNSESSGLGLSIVQQICKSFGYTLNYTFENEMHIIKIGF